MAKFQVRHEIANKNIQIYQGSLADVSNKAKENKCMQIKVILSKLIRWFSDHLFATILSLIATTIITALGGIYIFSMSALDYALKMLNTRTPLWMTIFVILLCGLYTNLKTRHKNPQNPPKVEEKLREEFGVYWNNQFKLRCLKCKWPLKCASKAYDPSIFWCSNCHEKFALRDPGGNPLTEANARSKLKELQRTDPTGLDKA